MNAESADRIQGETVPALFVIRQARNGDCPALRDFLAGLSPQTRYLRFFTGAPATSATMLRLLAGDGAGCDAVVATQAGTIIGHGMAVDASGPRGDLVTEIGVAVTDAWQGRGVGSALTRALVTRACDRGVSTLAMDVLPGNRRVLAMLAGHWPDARVDRSGDCVTIHARLRAQPAGRAPARPSPPPPAAAPVGAMAPGRWPDAAAAG